MSIEKHILIVDDELEIRKIIQEILKDEGYSTSTASSAKEARAEVKNKKPDLVFLDIWMPEEDGISLLKDWTSQPETDFPVIMISGHATIETAIEATKLGAKDFIEKPVSIEKLLASAQEFLAQSIIGEDIFPHLVQNTPAFKKTLDEINLLVKQNNIFVLQAEEGTEKAAWVRALYLSQYSNMGELQKIQFSGEERVENEESAALYKALGGFATNGVNLCKLESFSVKNTFDQVNFYIDIEGHIETPAVQKSLEELGFHTQKLDVLGVYEAHSFRFKK